MSSTGGLAKTNNMIQKKDNRRKDQLAEYIYTKLYIGKKMSLAQIAKRIGKTRQSVYTLFENRGYKLRKKKKLEKIVFNEVNFTPNNNGYLRRTDGNRELMHRYVWEFHYGRIPANHDIHHKNHDKKDNRIENLELLEKGEHTRQHQYKQHKEKYCLHCDIRMLRHNGEGYKAYQIRQFCSFACSRKWMKGKPQGTKVIDYLKTQSKDRGINK